MNRNIQPKVRHLPALLLLATLALGGCEERHRVAGGGGGGADDALTEPGPGEDAGAWEGCCWPVVVCGKVAASGCWNAWLWTECPEARQYYACVQPGQLRYPTDRLTGCFDGLPDEMELGGTPARFEPFPGPTCPPLVTAAPQG